MKNLKKVFVGISKQFGKVGLALVERKELAGKLLMTAIIAGLSINSLLQAQTRHVAVNTSLQAASDAESTSKGTSESASSDSKEEIKETGIIIASDVNLRTDSSTSSKVLSNLNKREKISILEHSGQWSKVETSRGDVGWVNNSLIGKKESDVRPDEKIVPMGQQVAQYSKKFLGVKYVWGGTTPKGFDCSGLVKYVYAKHGVSLERVAADQARQGTKVARKDLKAGDLVFFDTDGGHSYINHVGIYLGGGSFIEASSGRSTGRVVIVDMSSGFYSDTYMTARRIFK